MREATITKNSRTNAMNAVRRGRAESKSAKERQLDIILSSNPADDDNLSFHTWIRSVDDIHTYREAMQESGYSENEDVTPDFKAADVQEALRTGKVTVYSSHPIENGVFVTPSQMEAKNYAGGGRVYSERVRLGDVAWIDNLQGQIAKYKK